VEAEKWESRKFPKAASFGKATALGTAEMGHAAVSRSTAEETQFRSFAACSRRYTFGHSFMLTYSPGM
jgi:hypothetical protein